MSDFSMVCADGGEDALHDSSGGRGAAGDGDVDGDDVGDAAAAGVAFAEDAAGAAAVADGHHQLGVGCRGPGAAQGFFHVFRDRTGDQQ